MEKLTEIQYPRRSFIRATLKLLAKFFVKLLFEVKLSGVDNLPQKGPYIVIGNHVSALEPILMLIYTPQQLEFLGSGDIPIDPRMSLFSNLYEFIPIMRGQIDQTGLKNALSVLNQDGVLGVFPEGGIWERNLKEPKLGTSWICYKSKTMIVPIGFVGMNGALLKALSLKKPKVEVIIGKPIQFHEIFPSEGSIKSKMQIGAQKIIERVAILLPPEEIINPTQPIPNKLEFYLVSKIDSSTEKVIFSDQNAFEILIEHPVIMDVFKRNLRLNVDVLFKRHENISIKEIIISLEEILLYLQTNPGFLSYRFGIDQAIKMKNGVMNLKIILEDKSNTNSTFSINIVE